MSAKPKPRPQAAATAARVAAAASRATTPTSRTLRVPPSATGRARGAPRMVVSRGNAVAHVYEALRRDILGMRLAPGDDIDDAALGERMGLSRTPIREALSRLAGDGLVVQSPNRGVQVAPVNLMELPQYAEALSLLQRAVLRAAALRRTVDDLRSIEQTYDAFVRAAQSGDPAELTLSNRAFHVAIAQAGHNRYLSEAYARLLDEGTRMLSVPFAFDLDPTDSASAHTGRIDDDHREMIEVIRNRDAVRAEQLGAEHAELFRSRFIKYLEQNLLDAMPVDGSTTPARGPSPAKGLRRAK